jgi:hypothetical protein
MKPAGKSSFAKGLLLDGCLGVETRNEISFPEDFCGLGRGE